ncbi:MAG: isocitrate lyase/phosphoenolpyruvate mutase family protein [Candidatus Eremiobacteraeota bacterium]|nr:isocitrate lyase/phosphoenolpyruvate mutase family protein [Candidatus Eremiobacteraeota bacterium]
MTQREKAETLRSLHRPGNPLVLVNAWDAVSARIVEEAGFPAIATTSGGISWLEGYADGELISREQMLAGIARIVHAVTVPVTADLESGYGPTIEAAVSTAKGAIASGAVGLNFEDGDFTGAGLLPASAQCERITAIRKVANDAGIPLVINARTDVFLKDVGESQADRVAEAIARGNDYLQAGADCVFVPMVTDEATIAALVNRIRGPVNVLAAPATPTVARLGELGVARISVGASAMAFALTQLRAITRTIKEEGTFAYTGERLSHSQVNDLFKSRPLSP